jgi:uncharacterized membrane-anchored protein YhcB (DUF1043 family)
MSHFSPVDWADFTRGLLPPSESLKIQSHLDRRCEECLKSAEVWRLNQRLERDDEEFARVAEVAAKVQAAYSTARKLLAETGNETLLTELDALSRALDQLTALARSRKKPSPNA